MTHTEDHEIIEPHGIYCSVLLGNFDESFRALFFVSLWISDVGFRILQHRRLCLAFPMNEHPVQPK